jgi:hypothetical protein
MSRTFASVAAQVNADLNQEGTNAGKRIQKMLAIGA